MNIHSERFLIWVQNSDHGLQVRTVQACCLKLIPLHVYIRLSDGRMMADKYGCKYIETSAALNHRVDELLVGILKQILLKSSGSQSEERTPTNDVKSKDKDRKGSFKKTKHFLEKIFRRSGAKSKEKTTCENLYVD